ncbi:MAG: YkoF family thiamine/hydroxymethylpyrimidine-binding protein [Flavobacteriaceae bacterium]
MKLSAELTLTPLKEDFIPTIKSFIKSIRESKFVVLENPLSTQIYGDFDDLMTFLIPEIKAVFEKEDAIILQIKLVKGDRSQYEPDF